MRPRRICPRCGNLVALKTDGSFYRHTANGVLGPLGYCVATPIQLDELRPYDTCSFVLTSGEELRCCVLVPSIFGGPILVQPDTSPPVEYPHHPPQPVDVPLSEITEIRWA